MNIEKLVAKGCRRLVFSAVCLSFCLPTPVLSAIAHEQVDNVSKATFSIFQKRALKIAVITLSETSEVTGAISETLQRIEESFAPYPVTIERRKNINELEKEIKSGEVDAFIASSGFYWRMMKYGATGLATLISEQAPNPNLALASVFITRHDNSAVNDLEDMKGKVLSASYHDAFISFRTGMAELAARGFDPEKFFADIHYLGDTFNDLIASELDEKTADVALVRACWLESLPEQVRKQYKVINPIISPELKCVRSSRLYPNLMFAVTSGSPPGAAHRMSQVLLNMQPTFDTYHWGFATDFTSIDRLYRELKIEGYAYLRETTVQRWYEEHKTLVWLAVVILLGLLFHSWRVGFLVRERTKELRFALHKQMETQHKMDQLHERIENMQKATVLGHLSNMIAHELAQPLAVIQYYSDAIKRLMLNGKLTEANFDRAEAGLQKGLNRTKAIVDKVRSYGRESVKRETAVYLTQTFNTLISSMNIDLRNQVHCEIADFNGEAVVGDSLEIELLFYNLVKNAMEAAGRSSQPKVEVSSLPEDDRMLIFIVNSGAVMTAEDMKRLETPLLTTKSDGHGLGVSIARSLAEVNGGNIVFRPRKEGGLEAMVTLRRYRKVSEENAG